MTRIKVVDMNKAIDQRVGKYGYDSNNVLLYRLGFINGAEFADKYLKAEGK